MLPITLCGNEGASRVILLRLAEAKSISRCWRSIGNVGSSSASPLPDSSRKPTGKQAVNHGLISHGWLPVQPRGGGRSQAWLRGNRVRDVRPIAERDHALGCS